jgi:antitoxin ParD1/3/4
MPPVEKRTVSLPADQAAYIDRLVDRGGYATVSEVVRAGLRALQERDAVVERWLREEVLTAHDEAKANPESLLDLDEVFDTLEADIAARIAARDA